MKIQDYSNGIITIQANMKKEGDFEMAQKVAQKMEDDSCGAYEFIMEDDSGFVQVGTVWGHFQAVELKEAYQAAKAEVLAA